tara:strand:- start:358 stop:789 length:432 start_codon:yes stop_codon:yes gene_type:complete
MSVHNKLQSAEFNFSGENFCLMRDTVQDEAYVLYMEDNGKWAEMNWQAYFEDGDIDTLKMIEGITQEIIARDDWLPDSQMPSKPFAYYEEGHIYSFLNQKAEKTVEVEASCLDEASNIMFGDGEYDPNDWKLVLIDQVPITQA